MKRIISLLLATVLLVGCLAGLTLVSAANKYSISALGIGFIKSKEGFSARPVWDVSRYSIGYGTACPDPSAYPNGISVEEAEELLRSALVSVENKLNEFLMKNNIPLGQEQYDALVSFTYNVGTSWLKDSRLASMLLKGTFSPMDFASAIGVWCHTGNDIASGLVLRRVREIQLFCHGDYTGKNSPKYVYVQFNANGGSMLTDIYFFPQGSAYGSLQKSTKEGSKFLGWYKADGTKLTEDTIAMENLRVTAKWGAQVSASQVFSDLYEYDWWYTFVEDLYNQGVIDGYTDGTIRPRGDVTVGEAMKLIFLAAGFPAQTPSATDPGQWASGYRTLAITLGIIDIDEYTNLNQKADRLFIAKVASIALGLPLESKNPNAFSDTQDPYVLSLYDAGIVIGDNKGCYKPNDHITRAEIFTIVSRMMSK